MFLNKKKDFFVLGFIMPGLIILGTLSVGLFIIAFWNSLYRWNFLTGSRNFAFLYNYLKAIRDPRFWNALKVTLEFSFGSTISCFILGFFIALLLNRVKKYENLFMTIILIPMIIAPILTALVWRMLLDPYWGIINYFLNLLGFSSVAWVANPRTALFSIIVADVWQWTPFIIIVILSGLKSLPETPFEAAKIDGASNIQVFRYILIPLMKPVLLVAFIFRMMSSFKVFPKIFIMTAGGPGIATEALNYYSYLNGFHFWKMGYSNALAIIMLFVSLSIAWFLINKIGFKVE